MTQGADPPAKVTSQWDCGHGLPPMPVKEFTLGDSAIGCVP